MVRGGIIKDELMVDNNFPGVPPTKHNISNYDIYCVIGYIHVPVNFDYRIFEKSDWRFDIFLGGFFSIPVAELSSLDKKEFIAVYDSNNPDHNFNYYISEERCFGIGCKDYEQNYGYEFGLRTYYSVYYIEVRALIDMARFGSIYIVGPDISKKSFALNLLFGITL